MPVSGSYDAPGQFVPPACDGSIRVPHGPSGTDTVGGVKIGPIR